MGIDLPSLLIIILAIVGIVVLIRWLIKLIGRSFKK